MQNTLAVEKVSKRYDRFTLDDISFEIPRGKIVGLIGENGAGKSTTIKAVLGLITKDSGTVTMLGKQNRDIDNSVRNQISVVFDGSSFPEGLSPKHLNRIFKNIYAEWDEAGYYDLLKKLDLPEKQKIKLFSKGMKMKLSIAVSLSHKSKLLILDEATTGLDPIVRDDILDLFLDFVKNGENSILVSSHITSDLEKIADYIVFIHGGKVLFCKSKEALKQNYGIVRCDEEQYDLIAQPDIVAARKHGREWEILVDNRDRVQEKYPELVVEAAAIDDIMLLYIKGEEK